VDFLNQPSEYPVSLEQLLRLTVEKKGSDLHIVVGMPPCIRIDGDIVKQDYPPMKPADVENMLTPIMSEKDKRDLQETLELDLAYSVPQCARFRGNVIVQRGTLAAVFRAIPFEVPTLDRLGLPAEKIADCRLALDILSELGFIELEKDCYAVCVDSVKNPIENSEIFRKVQSIKGNK
jgi:twitching motility protein PilT